ncbi:uncharacterized protein LOC135439378 [Drosophila montana]|uniref:uncharacterized protein LOC135439378 n=1 Tax=Drosophila montana TaxID=40370 RepID=UPI00313BB76D
MRTITLCLLLLVSGSCLLGTSASDADSFDFEEVEAYGFIKSVEKALKKALTTVRGVNCTIKEVIEVMLATTNYVDAIDACGMAIPKDIAKIVKNCKSIIALCEDIIHLNSTICADEEDGKMTSSKCFLGLFEAIMKLSYKINTTLKLIAKLPADTESCFLDATKEVEQSYNDFLPNIDKCIEQM